MTTIKRFKGEGFTKTLTLAGLIIFGVGLWLFVASNAQAQTTNWRDDIGALRVGYLIEGDRALQRRRMEPFRLAMEKATGLTVAFTPTRTLDQLVKLQSQRRIQYAIHSASSYATLETFCKCLEILAAPTDASGAAGVHAIVLVPSNGTVNSLLDLKGKRLAVPAPPATVTRQVAFNELSTAGFGDPGALGEIIDVANPVEGWRQVLTGKADAIIGWSSLIGDISQGYSSGTMRHLIDVTRLSKSADMRIIWQSRIVPHGPHTIRDEVPTPLKQILRDFLLNMKRQNAEAFDAVSPKLSGGFQAVNHEDYTSLLRLTKPTSEN